MSFSEEGGPVCGTDGGTDGGDGGPVGSPEDYKKLLFCMDSLGMERVPSLVSGLAGDERYATWLESAGLSGISVDGLECYSIKTRIGTISPDCSRSFAARDVSIDHVKAGLARLGAPGGTWGGDRPSMPHWLR